MAAAAFGSSGRGWNWRLVYLLAARLCRHRATQSALGAARDALASTQADAAVGLPESRLAVGGVLPHGALHPANTANWIRYEGLERFLAAEADGKGVFIVTGHMGAWELSSFYHSLMGHPMGMVIRRWITGCSTRL